MESRARLKRWMTLVGLAGLVAGIPVGVALNETLREPLVEDSPWLQHFQVDFDLSAKQLNKVRRVLAVRERNIVEVYTRMGHDVSSGFHHAPSELSRTIDSIKRQADARIEAVLDSDQLDQYMKARPKADSARK